MALLTGSLTMALKPQWFGQKESELETGGERKAEDEKRGFSEVDGMAHTARGRTSFDPNAFQPSVIRAVVNRQSQP